MELPALDGRQHCQPPCDAASPAALDMFCHLGMLKHQQGFSIDTAVPHGVSLPHLRSPLALVRYERSLWRRPSVPYQQVTNDELAGINDEARGIYQSIAANLAETIRSFHDEINKCTTIFTTARIAPFICQIGRNAACCGLVP
ncbi:hypothetical protein [Janthinobacterium sp. 35]|uniref:hypothetical protein n=1 Tax=Janthinobacterium sp. 35 TaxID=2035210 RepID=UPI0015D48CB6|nr:hypothetical protein [Janthinobacterium sp. 35]